MFVLFRYDGTARVIKKVLKAKQRYSLNSAESAIRTAESTAREKQTKTSIVINIYSDDNALLYGDLIDFGEGNEYLNNLLLLVQHTFNTVFSDEDVESQNEFLTALREELEHENHTVIDAKPIHDSKTVADPYVDPQPQNAGNKHKSISFELPRFDTLRTFLSRVDLRSYWWVGAIAICMLLVFGGFKYVSSANQETTTPSYASLIKNGDYLSAGKYYPERRIAIEDKIAETGDEETLQAYQAKYPTQGGKFDIAFAHKRYSDVVSLSQNVTLNDTRKVKLAVAYLKNKQVDQAKVLNDELKNDDLSKLIVLGYVQTGQLGKARAMNATLKSDTLNKAIETGEAYQKAINQYNKIATDSKKSVSERAKAKQSELTFRHQLETLGE